MEEGSPAKHSSEEEAPEAGWGWIVAAGMCVMFTVFAGPLSCFSILFKDFLEQVGGGTQSFTLISSVLVTALSFTGLVTNFVMKKFSCRQVAIAGCLLSSSGNLLSVFATSVNYLVISYGIVQGVGIGLMITPTFTAFNTYFVKRRNFAMGLTQILIGVGCMLYPLLVNVLYSEYGFRGTQAILTAIALHTLPAVMTYHPVSWHLSRRTRRQGESTYHGADPAVIYSGNDKMASTDNMAAVTAPAEETAQEAKDSEVEGPLDGPEEKQQLLEQETTLTVEDSPAENANKRRKSVAISLDGKLDRNHDFMLTARASVDSVPVSSAAVLGHRGSVDPTRPSGKFNPKSTLSEKVIDFFDLKLLLDPVYSSIAVGLSVALVADLSFFTLLPVYLAHLGVAQVDVAVCLSVGAACDLAGRIALTLLGLVLVVEGRTVLLIGLCFTTLIRSVLIFHTDYTYLTIFTGMVGFFRPFILVELPLVIAEYCSLKRFPSAYGLFMIISGVFTLALGPIVGFIRDVTGSYTLCLHSLTILSMMCIIPWTFEMFIMRCKWRRSTSLRILNL